MNDQSGSSVRSQQSPTAAADGLLVKLVDLHKTYHMGLTDVRALAGANLEMNSGEFVSITGASGSGKSTMMGIVGCLDRPSSGAYCLNGQWVSDLSDRELARIRNEHLGFVFQTFNLLPRSSAVDNVAVPLFYARRIRTHIAAMEALDQVGLADRAKHTPMELSGGERQRVAIARAIVNHPKLLLADEPTGNLDSRTGAQIMMLFHKLHEQGVTIMIVTHEHEIATQTQRMVQMRDGKIIADGPVDAVVRQKAIDRARQLAGEPA